MCTKRRFFVRAADERSLKPLEERWRSGESGPESISASTRAMPVEQIEKPIDYRSVRMVKCTSRFYEVTPKKSFQFVHFFL